MTSPPPIPPFDFSGVPAAWRSRFEFFYRYGSSVQPTAVAALREMTWGERFRIRANVLAFLFGPLYFLVKGMWRKALTLFAIALVIVIVLSKIGVPVAFTNAVGVGMGVFASSVANYAYYLHVMARSTSWNPLEGFRRVGRSA